MLTQPMSSTVATAASSMSSELRLDAGEVLLQADEGDAESATWSGVWRPMACCRVFISAVRLRDGDAGLEAGDAEVVVVAFDFGELIRGPAEGYEGFQGMAGAAETAEQLVC